MPLKVNNHPNPKTMNKPKQPASAPKPIQSASAPKATVKPWGDRHRDSLKKSK